MTRRSTIGERSMGFVGLKEKDSGRMTVGVGGNDRSTVRDDRSRRVIKDKVSRGSETR